MPPKNPDLHGNVPDTATAVLVLIDVINDLEFEGAEALFDHMRPMAERLATLKRRAKAAGIPTVYANDNFGRWRSDMTTLLQHCLQEGVRGRPIVELLRPDADDYVVLKPKHSAFFASALETLLTYLGARTLILAGVAGNICVLFTANDAYMRDYHLVVPADCTASNTAAENAHALRQMATVLDADITPSVALDLEALKERGQWRWAGTPPASARQPPRRRG